MVLPLLLLGPPLMHNHPSSIGAYLKQPPPIPPPQKHRSLSNLLPQQNPCLDLFLCDPTLFPNLTHYLEKSYTHDPLTTLKLISTLRADTGKKSGNGPFFSAMLWLHKHHPLTLACNLKSFATFMSLTELLEILRIALERKIQTTIENKTKERIPVNVDREKMKHISVKKAKDIARAKRAVDRYKTDKKYRYLHTQMSKLFADILSSDIQFLHSGEIDKISTSSKYCPSLDSSFDKSTLICEGIARKLFPRESDAAYRGISESHYAFRVRDRLRKKVLVPLHKALDVINRANIISTDKLEKQIFKKDQERIVKVYRSSYQRLFTEDDDEKFRVYLEMADRYANFKLPYLPHQILASLKERNGGEEIQWRRLVDYLSKKGKFRNSIAICNISEGMKGTPMEDFSIAMGLLISELNEEPWKGKVFTYSALSKLCEIQGDTLPSRVKFIKEMKCDKNVFFSRVFDEILQVAVEQKVSEEKMVERIFVFTDMSFEMSSNNFWAKWASLAKYQSKGYKELPEILFWNIGEAVGVPVVQKHKGLVMMKGFSKSLVAMLLERGVVATPEYLAGYLPKPEEMMKIAISREGYEDLVVYD